MYMYMRCIFESRLGMNYLERLSTKKMKADDKNECFSQSLVSAVFDCSCLESGTENICREEEEEEESSSDEVRPAARWDSSLLHHL